MQSWLYVVTLLHGHNTFKRNSKFLQTKILCIAIGVCTKHVAMYEASD